MKRREFIAASVTLLALAYEVHFLSNRLICINVANYSFNHFLSLGNSDSQGSATRRQNLI